MSSNGRQTVSARDLVEEAKKRIVFLVVCVFGLSYLMSLTSPSVIVNFPAALILIIVVRYMSLDFEMRRKASTYKVKTLPTSTSKGTPDVAPRKVVQRSNWRNKVNSPIVEDAIDQLTHHIVSEWVTDLWYSRITPDRQGPEELVLIINGVAGEFSSRMKNINLIDLLTRDIVNIISRRLELFRESKVKIEKQQSRSMTFEERDIELKYVLAAENKLHPILFSAEAEHKVLQHVMNGFMLFAFRPEDLQCSLFCNIVRELLACVVIRPVLNLANPRFINEKIESLVVSRSKSDKRNKENNTPSQSRASGPPIISSDYASPNLDPSTKGVELVQLKKDQNNKTVSDNAKQTILSKDPLLSMDTRSTRSWSSLPEVHSGEGGDIHRQHSGVEWGDNIDKLSRRKTVALAPEHFEDMWTKGRNYKRSEDVNQLAHPAKGNSSAVVNVILDNSKVRSDQKNEDWNNRNRKLENNFSDYGYDRGSGPTNAFLHSNFSKESWGSTALQEDVHESLTSDEGDSRSSGYSEDDESSIITGLNSPSVRVWDGKNKRTVSRIHHPLETFDGKKDQRTKMGKGILHSKRSNRTKSSNKRTRSSNHSGNVWQEVERTSYLLGDGQDLLNSSQTSAKAGDSSDEYEAEILGRINNGAATASSVSLASIPESHVLSANSAKHSVIADPFFRLRSEVFGANVVRSGSKTFAVYCISVTDINNKNWSIKRRFQHFEELHRRLKEFPEYNLHLPPKHFLSTGLDLFVIQERCKLLDQYLKKLLQLPTVSASIEVWDFLSVDSQMYKFADSLSIIETLSVDMGDRVYVRGEDRNSVGHNLDLPSSRKDNSSNEIKVSTPLIKDNHVSDTSRLKSDSRVLPSSKILEKEIREAFEDLSSDSENADCGKIISSNNWERTVKTEKQAAHSVVNGDPSSSDPTLPSEWIPPSLSVPILDLVDVILQLKDGGWIRRKAFWIAKQVLQLGMGDAFDDWLIHKIQILRKGSVVASGIRRLEKILWPDGIFLTKHPKRRQPSSANPPNYPPDERASSDQSSPKAECARTPDETQQMEAERQAKFVYELMIDKAPAAIVGLVGRKEYEKCAKDLYYFIQSSIFMKQIAFDLLQLLFLSAFPELDYVFRQLENEKDRFGEPKLK